MDLNRSTKIIMASIIGVVLLVGVVNIVVALMVKPSSPETASHQTSPTAIVTETVTPTPTPTPTETISETEAKITLANQVIDNLWTTSSKKEKQDLCMAYLIMPEMAEETFKDSFGTSYGVEVQNAAWEALTKKLDADC